MTIRNNNIHSIDYYDKIIKRGLALGYNFVTLREFVSAGCPSKKFCILRHDLDTKPQTLEKMLKIEYENNVKSSIFVRVTANDYNAFSYPVLQILKKYEHKGFEIGLHTSCVEYGEINKIEPIKVLSFEYQALNSFFDIKSVAPHRDLNYAYNSLPFLEENANDIKSIGLVHQAYDNIIMDNTLYVNEGFNPHLCWRNLTPEEAFNTGNTVYMLTHNHWWYENHPFEEWM
jgi:hypothetical protein